jgi:hypothetical protein
MFSSNYYLEGLAWLTLLIICAVYVDDKVPAFLSLYATKLGQALYSRFNKIWLHPKSPLFKLQTKLNSNRNARKLAKELNLDKHKDWK